MTQRQVVLDTCMVIDIMEADIFAQKMRRRLRGKSIRFVLTDVVCREAKKVVDLMCTAYPQGFRDSLGGRWT